MTAEFQGARFSGGAFGAPTSFHRLFAHGEVACIKGWIDRKPKVGCRCWNPMESCILCRFLILNHIACSSFFILALSKISSSHVWLCRYHEKLGKKDLRRVITRVPTPQKGAYVRLVKYYNSQPDTLQYLAQFGADECSSICWEPQLVQQSCVNEAGKQQMLEKAVLTRHIWYLTWSSLFKSLWNPLKLLKL